MILRFPRNLPMKTILLIVAVPILMGGGNCPTPEPDRSFDSDGDGISNAVETNPANSHLGFDPQAPDENPSIAHGTPNNGTLEGGINLPDVGTGYIHFPLADPVDFDDWGTLALINLIEASGRCWIGDNTQPRMQSLDMSLQGGGDWSGHTSHQNGLDVDMRYLRTDDQEIGINIATDQAHYDQEATQRIIDCIIACGNVQGIFVDLANSRLEGAPVEHVNGHADHFHVRIYDPDGTDN